MVSFSLGLKAQDKFRDKFRVVCLSITFERLKVSLHKQALTKDLDLDL